MKYYHDPEWLMDEIKLVRSIATGPIYGEDPATMAGYCKGTNRAVTILLESIIDALGDQQDDAEKLTKELRKVVGA